MRSLAARLWRAGADGVLTRRQLLARAVLALLPEDDVSLEKKVPLFPLALGPIHKPIPEFSNMTDTAASGFVGVKDPLGSENIVVRNVHPSGLADAHVTMGTSRDLAKGSTSVVAHDWLYAKPADLIQTGRNLISQLQMEGSPIWAISTRIVAGVYRVEFVERVNGTERRHDLGILPWGHYVFPVVDCKLDNAVGRVTCWYAVDDWPDVNATPRWSFSGDTWQDGRNGHHTIGQYATHSKAGVYTGYFGRFGRATTAQRAIELAG